MSALGWPYGQATESEVIATLEKDLKRFGVPRGSALLSQSVWVFGLCLVPIYGVLFLGWDAFALIVLFYGEGLIALALDFFRLWIIKATSPPKRHSQQLGVWVFSVVFLNFSGFFMLLFQGPHGKDLFDSISLLSETLKTTLPSLKWPFLIAAVFQLIALSRDWQDTGKGHDMHLTAGPYMILIFLTPMIAFVFSLFGSPEIAGLMVITVFRMLGQLLLVWIVPLFFYFASKEGARD